MPTTEKCTTHHDALPGQEKSYLIVHTVVSLFLNEVPLKSPGSLGGYDYQLEIVGIR